MFANCLDDDDVSGAADFSAGSSDEYVSDTDEERNAEQDSVNNGSLIQDCIGEDNNVLCCDIDAVAAEGSGKSLTRKRKVCNKY